MPDPRPLSNNHLAALASLPSLIRRNAWTAAEEAADAIRDLVREVERLRKLPANLGEPELQHRLIGANGSAHTPTGWDLAHKGDWLPGVRHEVRDVYPTAWRPVDTQDPTQPSSSNGATS